MKLNPGILLADEICLVQGDPAAFDNRDSYDVSRVGPWTEGIFLGRFHGSCDLLSIGRFGYHHSCRLLSGN